MFRSPNSRRALPEIDSLRIRDRPGDPVPPERRALDPEQGDLGLICRALAGSDHIVAAELLAHAEFVDKLQAVCHRCGGGATTTQRLVDGRPAPYSGATIVVGANEQYEARCRDCHEAGTAEAGTALVTVAA